MISCDPFATMKTIASTNVWVFLNLAYEPVTIGLIVNLDGDQQEIRSMVYSNSIHTNLDKCLPP